MFIDSRFLASLAVCAWIERLSWFSQITSRWLSWQNNPFSWSVVCSWQLNFEVKLAWLVLGAIFSENGDDKLVNVFIQLSRWNSFKFPVFHLRFQKHPKQSYISFSFLSGIFLFLLLKYIINPSKQKQTEIRPFFKACGFCATALAWRSLQCVDTLLVKFLRLCSWLDER